MALHKLKQFVLTHFTKWFLNFGQSKNGKIPLYHNPTLRSRDGHRLAYVKVEIMVVSRACTVPDHEIHQSEHSLVPFSQRFDKPDYCLPRADTAIDPQPERNLRERKRYERKQSPLTKIDWWRVVLDEAQMVESGVSNAARVSQLIPRQNAWAVSGTPVKKDAKDLYGLLIFLRYQPYCSSTSLWDRLVVRHRDVLWRIFEEIALRHTKDQIKTEILLPPQNVSIYLI